MAYITYDDVDNELSTLGELVPEGKEALSWVNNKIASAELEINARLSAVCVTPVTSTTALNIVKIISLNLTCYYILRQNYTQEESNSSGWVSDYKTTAEDLLRKIEDGVINLEGITTDYAMSSTLDVARKLTSDTYDPEGNSLTTGTMGDWL